MKARISTLPKKKIHSRSAGAQKLHSGIMNYIKKGRLGISEKQFIRLIKNKEFLQELSINRMTHLHDIINLSVDNDQEWKEQSARCHYLLKLVLRNGDPVIIKKLMNTKNSYRNLPSAFIFQYQEDCWKEYFNFLKENKATDTNQQFLNKSKFKQDNKYISHGILEFILEKMQYVMLDLERYFQALYFCLEEKLIVPADLQGIFSSRSLRYATRFTPAAYFLIKELCNLKERYGFNLYPLVEEKNKEGFNFILSLLGHLYMQKGSSFGYTMQQRVEMVKESLTLLQDHLSTQELATILKEVNKNNYTVLHEAAGNFCFQRIASLLIKLITENHLVLNVAFLLKQEYEGKNNIVHLLTKGGNLNDLQLFKLLVKLVAREKFPQVWDILINDENNQLQKPQSFKHVKAKEINDYLNKERSCLLEEPKLTTKIQMSLKSASLDLKNGLRKWGLFKVNSTSNLPIAQSCNASEDNSFVKCANN